MDQSLQTKTLLALSLKKFMAVKPFNKITVRELAEDCGINRQTFYYHFDDIVDLLEWMYQNETLVLISKISGNPFNWKEAVLATLKYVQENAAVCLCALRSIGNKQLRNFFYKDFQSMYNNLIGYIASDLDVDQEFMDFFSNLLICGAEGMMIRWLETGMKESPEQLTEWLSIYLEGNIRSTLVRYSEYKAAKKENS